MRLLTLGLSLAAMAVSGAAFAQSPATPARAAKPDMSRAQVLARAEASFARMDANRDGTVDQADRAARRAGMFDRIDSDRNGSISRAEFAAMQAQRGDKAGARAGRKGPGARGAMAGAERRAAQPLTRQAFLDRSLAMFDRADTDRNGTVTQAERATARDGMRQQRRDRRAPRQQG